MITVSLYNCKDKAIRAHLKEAAAFYIKRLLPRKKRLLVKIYLKEGLLEKDGMSGSCSVDDYAVNRRHYEFNVHVEPTLELEEMLSILAHELTHVKQYATGQLLYDRRKPEISIWEGVRYDDSEIEYEDQPWEIDAVYYEELLLEEFKKTVDWI